jgi:hypothetical protein
MGAFGKVVVASPAQHLGRGQPEVGYNGPPSLVWVLGPHLGGVWAATASPAGSPTTTNRSDGVAFGARPGRPTSPFEAEHKDMMETADSAYINELTNT